MNKILPAVLGIVNIVLFVIIIKGASDQHKSGIADAPQETVTAAVSASEYSISASEQTSAVTERITSADTEISENQTFRFEIITRGSTGVDPQSTEAPPATTAENTTTSPPETTTTAPPATTTTARTTTVLPATTAAVRTTAAAYDNNNIGRPAMSDFDWLRNIDNYPAEVRTTDPEKISGRWKAMLYYLNEDETDIGIYELLNIDIMAGYGSTTVTFDWYRMYIENSEWYDESDMGDISFYPSFDDGTMYGGSDYGTLSLDLFWEYEGHQYGLGLLYIDDDNIAYLALTRP